MKPCQIYKFCKNNYQAIKIGCVVNNVVSTWQLTFLQRYILFFTLSKAALTTFNKAIKIYTIIVFNIIVFVIRFCL